MNLSIFIQNKYYNWYFNIINNAKLRINEGYVEKHHIIPKSLGGNDDESNLVELSPKAHCIVHLLLPKMTSGMNRRKMLFAIRTMTMDKTGKRYNSKSYEYYRKQINQAISEHKKGKRFWPPIGKAITKQHCDNLSKAFKKSKSHHTATMNNLTKMHKANAINGHPRQDVKHTIETKMKMRKPKSTTINMSIAKRNRVPCYDQNGNYHLVAKEEFHANNELVSIRSTTGMQIVSDKRWGKI